MFLTTAEYFQKDGLLHLNALNYDSMNTKADTGENSHFPAQLQAISNLNKNRENTSV